MREDRSANIVVAVKAGEGDIPTAEAEEGCADRPSRNSGDGR
jgi:hypothetical protein